MKGIWIGAILVGACIITSAHTTHAQGQDAQTQENEKETAKMVAAEETADTAQQPESKLEPGTYAVFNTSAGTITCRLFTDKTPVTCQNLIGLAEGTKEWVDPRTRQKVKRPFYDGLTFHRVIPEFMIQGGCPLGNGRGGPGYKFKDEFNPSLRFDRPGLLAMANSGPNTNGAQFFITEKATPWLNNRHTIFGEVVEGLDIVNKIARVKTDRANKPLEPVVIDKLEIVRVEKDKE